MEKRAQKNANEHIPNSVPGTQTRLKSIMPRLSPFCNPIQLFKWKICNETYEIIKKHYLDRNWLWVIALNSWILTINRSQSSAGCFFPMSEQCWRNDDGLSVLLSKSVSVNVCICGLNHIHKELWLDTAYFFLTVGVVNSKEQQRSLQTQAGSRLHQSECRNQVNTKQKNYLTQFGTRLFVIKPSVRIKLVWGCYENYSNQQQEQNGLT